MTMENKNARILRAEKQRYINEIIQSAESHLTNLKKTALDLDREIKTLAYLREIPGNQESAVAESTRNIQKLLSINVTLIMKDPLIAAYIFEKVYDTQREEKEHTTADVAENGDTDEYFINQKL